MKLFICQHCGNIAEMIKDSQVNPHCCGEKMLLLNAKESEEGQEKHLPVVSIENNVVSIKVGSTAHPMILIILALFFWKQTRKSIELI